MLTFESFPKGLEVRGEGALSPQEPEKADTLPER